MNTLLKAVLVAASMAGLGPHASFAAEAVAALAGNSFVIPGVKSVRGQVFLPRSSIQFAEDIGVRVHTNYEFFVPAGGVTAPKMAPDGTLSPVSSGAETPASIACVYRLVQVANGCNVNRVSAVAKGGSKVIVIVDAYHDPNALSDLQAFSKEFGLSVPPDNNAGDPRGHGNPAFEVIYCNVSKCDETVATPPQVDLGWAGEISLDVQWAHAMAPRAKIILIEAHTNLWSDINRAEAEAGYMASTAGTGIVADPSGPAPKGGVVSNSFGGSEFPSEQNFDHFYKHANAVVFASTGDTVGTEYPAVSPYVVAVGGTTIRRDGLGNLTGEQAWYNSDFGATGGGVSRYVAIPTYQDIAGVRNVVGRHRGIPDIAADADPNTGVWVLCTPCGGWGIIGGTSLASPLVAAMTNAAASFNAGGADEHVALYRALDAPVFYRRNFFDVVKNGCGSNAHLPARTGYDLCTGVGTPRGLGGL